MGLDTTHGCWRGPYSAFSRWRQAVAVAAGWRLIEVEGAYGSMVTVPREINWEALDDRNYLGEWDRLPEDPLVVLIAHSDCDGIIPVEALVPLAERLEAIIPATPEPASDPEYRDPEPRGLYDGVRNATIRFAEGLRRAAAEGEPVVFG